MNIDMIRGFLVMCGGALGVIFGAVFGEMTVAFKWLLILIVIDYVSGIIVAAFFGKSRKSADGNLDSRASIKGLFGKGGILAMLLVAKALDDVMGTAFVFDGAVLAFMVNEAISILENYALTGKPIPEVIEKALTQVNDRSGKHD